MKKHKSNVFLASSGLILLFQTTLSSLSFAAEFSPEAWLKAPRSEGDWSRKDQVEDFCKKHKVNGMSRKEVLAFLGEPTLSVQVQPCSKYESIIDSYLVSKENKESFQIYYDKSGKVTQNVMAGACISKLCIPASASSQEVLPEEKLNKILAQGAIDGTIGDIESLLGKSQKNFHANTLVGGRYWNTYSYLWRMSPDGRKVFVVDGREPIQKSQARVGSQSEERVRNYSIETMSADCPVAIP